MFNQRGGFPGQRPMGHSPMNHPGVNMSGMNMHGVKLSPMNQPNMNLSGMNHQGINHPGMNHPRMGLPGTNNPGIGLSGMNLNRMNHPGMNQGGMGFPPEMKGQGFGPKPMDSPGSFMGGNPDPMGMKAMPLRSPMHPPGDRFMSPQSMPQRFTGPPCQIPPRMQNQNEEMPPVSRVMSHSSDQMMGKPQPLGQEHPGLMKQKQWDALQAYGSPGQNLGVKPMQSSTPEQRMNLQNRYTNESASSILESFGLSNEDLEELSRYPDDQLTPSNMPGILRDIRLRKINRPGSAPDQGGVRRPGNEVVPSKVIDYGHASKYKIDSSASSRPYDSSRNKPKPVTVHKEAAASGNKAKKPGEAMDNKIPTISGSRKPMWQPTKTDRSNNKTLVEGKSSSDGSAGISSMNQPRISDSSGVPGSIQTNSKPEQIKTVVSQVNYQSPVESLQAGKGSWMPATSQEDPQIMKKVPTPSMMNDYYAASPRIFPHICSLCNLECRYLKDWIKHQNTAAHIESCRNLRLQYPEWNPQVFSSIRNDGKKDEASSKSPGSRRSRRSGSRNRVRTYSHSPRSRRSRSRSPRSSGRRSRSRSHGRSRYSPRRSRSPRSHRRGRSPRTHSNSPDKRAVDAAVQSFIEASKLKSGDKKSPKAPISGKKLPPKLPGSNVKSKKPPASATPAKKGNVGKPAGPSSASNSSKKPAGGDSSNSNKKPSNVTAQKPSSGNSNSKKPASGTAAPRKPTVSTAAKKTTPSTSMGRKPASGKQPPSNGRKAPSPKKTQDKPSTKSSYLLNKFISSANIDRVIHVTNLPDSGYSDQDILKIVQPFGKVCDILIVRSKNEAFLETNFKEAAAAAVKFSETRPVIINSKRVTLFLAGQKTVPEKTEDKSDSSKEPAKKLPAQTVTPTKDIKNKEPEKRKHNIVVPPGFMKCHKLADPPLKDSDKCVLLISNLPETQYTVDEVSNLAKPFGGVNDLLVISNHRKAYLELVSRHQLDSMIKFYNVFPTYLGGNLLSISMAQRFKDLKDEDRIFADIIEQTPYKITPTIFQKFVHLKNLPDKDLPDLDITRVAFRFGKVEHFIVIRNKRKAILHLHHVNAAKAMHSFHSKFSCSIAETSVQVSLSSKTKLAEDEYITFLEEKKSSVPVRKVEEKKAQPADDKGKEPVKSEAEVVETGPAGEEKTSEAKPPAAEKASETYPPNEEKTSETKLPTEEKNSEINPLAEEKASEPGSLAEDMICETGLLTEEKVCETGSLPPEEKTSETGPAAVEKASETGPAAEAKASESRPLPDGKTSETRPTTEAKVPQTKPPAESKASETIQPAEVKASKTRPPPEVKAPETKQIAKAKVSETKPNAKTKAPQARQPAKAPESRQPVKAKAPESNKLGTVNPLPNPPVSMSEMDVDVQAASQKSSDVCPLAEPSQPHPAPCTEAAQPKPASLSFGASILAVQAAAADDDDDDDEEEAAEAPEAPETPVYLQPKPLTPKEEVKPFSQPLASEDLEILVSVESDEEECVESYPTFHYVKPVMASVRKDDHGVTVSGQSDDHNRDSSVRVSSTENIHLESKTDDIKCAKSKVSSAMVASTPPSECPTGVSHTGAEDLDTAKEEDDKLKPTKKDKSTTDEAKQSGEINEELEGVVVDDHMDLTVSIPLKRTAKYNPQKGEISVTLTVDNQKSSVKTPEHRRTSSREKGRDSSTPKSNSSRSSPSDSSSGNPKSSTGHSQRKTGGKWEPRVASRSREQETRSSTRKDDRPKGSSSSSSSRYTRSHKSGARSPRAKEEEDFPFNLDEFVTVDEIVEENADAKIAEENKSSSGDSASRKGKRKETDSPSSDPKKSKVAKSKGLAFVTLDEIGFEDDNAGTAKTAGQTIQPLVTVDKVHAEDAPQRGKDAKALMTLDEISDEDDTTPVQPPSAVPEILSKDQLLTLDEISGEDEEQPSPSKSLAQETESLQDIEVKDECVDEDAKTTEVLSAEPQSDPGLSDQVEQPLLTLDEVKADDEEESIADIEHQFLTVDEIGEEEEEPETKVEEKEKSATSENKSEETETSTKPAEKTPGKRGRPRKRPLPQSNEAKEAAPQTPSNSAKTIELEKTPNPIVRVYKMDLQKDLPSASPDKPDSGDQKSETPAKKKKTESPAKEKPTLAPFNPSVPVGLSYLVPKTGYFCELCSLFYMDEASKLKHCRSLRHYQAIEKHLATSGDPSEEKPSST